MKVVDIADQIYRELNLPSDLSLAFIAFWLRSNVGKLNNSIGASYSIDETTLEVEDEDGEELGINESSILKKMFLVYYYGRKANEVLASSSTDGSLEVTSDGVTVRRVNKNEVSKTYLTLKNGEQSDLNALVQEYKQNKVEPLQVTGNDVDIPVILEETYVRGRI